MSHNHFADEFVAENGRKVAHALTATLNIKGRDDVDLLENGIFRTLLSALGEYEPGDACLLCWVQAIATRRWFDENVLNVCGYGGIGYDIPVPHEHYGALNRAYCDASDTAQHGDDDTDFRATITVE